MVVACGKKNAGLPQTQEAKIRKEVMMKSCHTRQLVLLMLMLTFLFGCSIKLQNHTPPEFPWQVTRDLPSPEEVLYPGSTPEQLVALGEDPKHRFILEIKPQNVSDIRAYITVNGTEHSMQGSGSGLWKYESTSDCYASYTYHFRVRYRAGLYGQRNKTLGSSAEPLSASVTNFGQAIWYVPLLAPNSGDGEVRFVAAALEEVTIVVQNLRNTPIVPYSIGLANLAGITDNAQFQVLNVPTLPVQLNCGDSLSFRVKWNPPSTTASATGALRILANPMGGSAWFRTVILKGTPHPS